jgi:hypothetical protein
MGVIMALRIARGMFRLWLVLSALWVSGVALVTWNDLPSDPWAEFHPVAATPQANREVAPTVCCGLGGSREDIGKHYDDYVRFGEMTVQDQQRALAALHNDTNISIGERRRLEKMMLDRRGPAMPPGVPQGSRAQRSDSTGLVRWLAPDGTVYSPTG